MGISKKIINENTDKVRKLAKELKKLKKFEEIVEEVLNDLQDNETLTIEFSVFDNSDLGGEAFEFLSAIFQYGSPSKVDGAIDLCKSTDELQYEDYINVVFEAVVNNPKENIKFIFPIGINYQKGHKT